MNLKPAKKKAATEKPLTDFFGKAPPKLAATKTKAVPAKKLAPKKVVDTDGDISMDEPPSVPKRNEAPRRAARAVPKTYIDISDDGGGSGSEFEDFD